MSILCACTRKGRFASFLLFKPSSCGGFLIRLISRLVRLKRQRYYQEHKPAIDAWRIKHKRGVFQLTRRAFLFLNFIRQKKS